MKISIAERRVCHSVKISIVERRVCHSMKISIAECNPDTEVMTQHTFDCCVQRSG